MHPHLALCLIMDDWISQFAGNFEAAWLVVRQSDNRFAPGHEIIDLDIHAEVTQPINSPKHHIISRIKKNRIKQRGSTLLPHRKGE